MAGRDEKLTMDKINKSIKYTTLNKIQQWKYDGYMNSKRERNGTEFPTIKEELIHDFLNG